MGGDPAPMPTNESMAQIIDAVVKGLPSLAHVVSQELPKSEQAQIDVKKKIAPQEQQLSADLYRQFGPILNSIGQDIYRQNQLAQTTTDSDILAGKGKDLAANALALQRSVDPEYFSTRAATAKSWQGLLDGLDPNTLSGGELASVERGLNRGNFNAGLSSAPSAQTGVRNALQFSDRLNQKRAMLSQALGNAPGIAQSTRSGLDPYAMATGKQANQQFGAHAFTGATPQGFGQSTMGLTSGLLGEAGQNQRQFNDIQANRRDSLDRFNESFSSVVGSL